MKSLVSAGLTRARGLAKRVDRRTLLVAAGLAALVALAVGAACGKSSTGPNLAAIDAGSAAASANRTDAGVVQVAVPAEDLWTIAEQGEEDDLARLADREGASELAEEGRAARTPARRNVALRALAYSEGYAGLPWLAEVADADNDDAKIAVASIDALAARKRTSEDPEDATELREGCDRLLVIAKNVARAKPVRIGAVRALRMWADRGCAKPDEIPADVDAR